MIVRREFLIGLVGFSALVSCGPAGPGSVTMVAQGVAGMNPGPDGSDRPLTLQIVQMRGSGAFDGKDFFSLQNPAAALGGDFIKADQITLAPSGKASKTIGLDAGVMMIGVIAGFRDPAGKVFRAKSAVSATEAVTFQLNVTANGISLVPA